MPVFKHLVVRHRVTGQELPRKFTDRIAALAAIDWQPDPEQWLIVGVEPIDGPAYYRARDTGDNSVAPMAFATAEEAERFVLSRWMPFRWLIEPVGLVLHPDDSLITFMLGM